MSDSRILHHPALWDKSNTWPYTNNLYILKVDKFNKIIIN